eukprot:2183639-Rhodomonas_salina.1
MPRENGNAHERETTRTHPISHILRRGACVLCGMLRTGARSAFRVQENANARRHGFGNTGTREHAKAKRNGDSWGWPHGAGEMAHGFEVGRERGEEH